MRDGSVGTAVGAARRSGWSVLWGAGTLRVAATGSGGGRGDTHTTCGTEVTMHNSLPHQPRNQAIYLSFYPFVYLCQCVGVDLWTDVTNSDVKLMRIPCQLL